jgi:hypothetical protein
MTRTRKQLATIFLTIAAAISLTVVLTRHYDSARDVLQPCPTEDSHNCLWRSKHGGQNFVDIDGTHYLLPGPGYST